MDRILEAWLRRQWTDWEALAPRTDRVLVAPATPESPCTRYLAEFRCRGLVREADGSVVEADRFLVGIAFGDDHLRRIEPLQLVTLLAPQNLWHPNALPPAICPGHLRPGVGLIDLLYQVYSILTGQNVNVRSPLNPEAATWAIQHPDRFPVDRRPLKRQTLALQITEVSINDAP